MARQGNTTGIQSGSNRHRKKVSSVSQSVLNEIERNRDSKNDKKNQNQRKNKIWQSHASANKTSNEKKAQLCLSVLRAFCASTTNRLLHRHEDKRETSPRGEGEFQIRVRSIMSFPLPLLPYDVPSCVHVRRKSACMKHARYYVCHVFVRARARAHARGSFGVMCLESIMRAR